MKPKPKTKPMKVPDHLKDTPCPHGRVSCRKGYKPVYSYIAYYKLCAPCTRTLRAFADPTKELVDA